MLKKLHEIAFIFIFLGIFNISYSQNIETFDNKISPLLLKKLKNNKKIDFIIYLKDQLQIDNKENVLNKYEQAQNALSQLKNHNLSSQNNIVRILELKNYKYKRFFIVNAILVKGDLQILQILAKRRDIAYITFDSPVKNEFVTDIENETFNEIPTTWGIKMIKADSVWQLGYKGDGIVIGGQDTGYDWIHPALHSKYRGYTNGNLSEHNYNWHDAIHDISPLNNDSIIDPSNNPCGLDITVPCDDYSHGTHTMGTMVGSSDNYKIGVAPAAKWIGCRNMERGWGKPSTYIECFEWFMAPTDIAGQNPDPAKSPDVINNSWGCPVKEGCDSTNWQYMELALNNLRNSGVFIVVSAGNDGIDNCGSISKPASMFENSFAVGATRLISDTTGLTFRDTIAGFSSRGPVIVDGSYRLKPDISAPGQSVLSCVPGNKYRFASGTSMAGPHVAGIVALMLSANPDLKGKTDKIKEIIEETADPRYDIDSCRGIEEQVVPNSIYGYGRINALAAVKKALEIRTSNIDITKKDNDIVVYPNPASTTLKLKFKNPTDNITFSVFDQLGNIRIKKPITKDAVINIGNLEKGIYFIKINADKDIFFKRIIKL